jgi:hypothetical protein
MNMSHSPKSGKHRHFIDGSTIRPLKASGPPDQSAKIAQRVKWRRHRQAATANPTRRLKEWPERQDWTLRSPRSERRPHDENIEITMR